MYVFFDKLIRFFAYSLVMLGLGLVIYPIFRSKFYGYTFLNRFRVNLKRNKQKNNPIIKHLELLFSATLNTKSGFAILMFFTISISCFIITFLLMLDSDVKFHFKFIFSLIISLIPYLILRLKLYSIRIEGSYEGEFLVTELTNQYKLNFLNMIEAIDNTIPHLKEQPYMKKALSKLAYNLKEYRTQDEINDILNEFIYHVDTQWAILLANNIFLSIEYEDDVTESLNDILNEFRDLKLITEKNKQNNYESFVMIKYIIPISYILTIYISVKYFSFTLDKFINYQLHHPMGLKSFIVTMLFMIFNFVIYYLIKKPKYDF